MKQTVSFLIAILAVQASTRAVPNQLFKPDDNPHGSVEVNSQLHDPGQSPSALHGDDKWPDLFPPVAVTPGALWCGVGPAIVPLPSPVSRASATNVVRGVIMTPTVGLETGLMSSNYPLPSDIVLPKESNLLNPENIKVHLVSAIWAYLMHQIAALKEVLTALQTMTVSTTRTEEMTSVPLTTAPIQKRDSTYPGVAAPVETGAQEWQQCWGHGPVSLRSGTFLPSAFTPGASATAAPFRKRDVDFLGLLVPHRPKNRVPQRQPLFQPSAPVLTRAIEVHTEYTSIPSHRNHSHTRAGAHEYRHHRRDWIKDIFKDALVALFDVALKSKTLVGTIEQAIMGMIKPPRV